MRTKTRQHSACSPIGRFEANFEFFISSNPCSFAPDLFSLSFPFWLPARRILDQRNTSVAFQQPEWTWGASSWNMILEMAKFANMKDLVRINRQRSPKSIMIQIDCSSSGTHLKPPNMTTKTSFPLPLPGRFNPHILIFPTCRMHAGDLDEPPGALAK
ncbi:hypothetical protein VTI28DRAFT_3839 [Corynascus sepedonium]